MRINPLYKELTHREIVQTVVVKIKELLLISCCISFPFLAIGYTVFIWKYTQGMDPFPSLLLKLSLPSFILWTVYDSHREDKKMHRRHPTEKEFFDFMEKVNNKKGISHDQS